MNGENSAQFVDPSSPKMRTFQETQVNIMLADALALHGKIISSNGVD